MDRKATLITSIVILVVSIFIAIFPSILTSHDPCTIIGSPLKGPDEDHILGTNDLGQDIFTRLVYGTRATLFMGFFGASLTILIGTCIGIISGYYGGIIDEFITRAIDVIMTIPMFPLLLVLVMFLEPSIWTITILMGILGGAGPVRIIRSQVLSLSESNFVYGVKAIGAGDAYVMIMYIFLNILPLVIVKFVFAAQNYMLLGVGLGFLGIGDPNVVDWGQMINRAYSNGGFAMGLWWWLLPPGLSVVVLSLAIFLFGYSFEERLNPRLRRGVL